MSEFAALLEQYCNLALQGTRMYENARLRSALAPKCLVNPMDVINRAVIMEIAAVQATQWPACAACSDAPLCGSEGGLA